MGGYKREQMLRYPPGVLVVMLSLVLSASDTDDVAGLVKRAQAMAASADPSCPDARDTASSEAAATRRKEAPEVQARPTLKKKEAVALLNARVMVAERHRAILPAAPVLESTVMLGDQRVAAWQDSVETWKRSLAAEAARTEEAKQRARAP